MQLQWLLLARAFERIKGNNQRWVNKDSLVIDRLVELIRGRH